MKMYKLSCRSWCYHHPNRILSLPSIKTEALKYSNGFNWNSFQNRQQQHFSSKSNYKENIVISSSRSSSKKIQNIVKRVQECSVGSITNVMIRQICQTIDSLAASQFQQPKNGKLAYDLLDRLIQEENKTNTTILNSQTYHNAMKCMIKSTNPTFIHKANGVLQTLEHKFITNKNNNKIKNQAHPILRTYTLLFDSLKYLDVRDATISERVQNLLDRIEHQEVNGNKDVILNTTCFNAALNALFSSENDGIANQRGMSLLNQFAESKRIALDHITFSIAMKAFVNQQNFSITGMEQIFNQMQKLGHKPNAITMTPILNAFAKNGDSDNAIRVLEWMQELATQQEGFEDIRPNRVHYNTLIVGLSNDVAGKNIGKQAIGILRSMQNLYVAGDKNMKPDLMLYNSVLNVISKDKDHKNLVDSKESAAESAESLLREMEYAQNEGIYPDIISYNSVLTAWMNINHSPTAAIDNIERLMHEMEEKRISPNSLTYAIYLNAFANFKTYEFAERAETILRQLERNYLTGKSMIQPDMKCYNSVLRAWANCKGRKSLGKTRKIFQEMKNNDLKPDVESYTHMIHALANSSERNRAHDAQSLLDELIESSIQQNDFSGLQPVIFNVVINAWAKSGEEDAATRAETILKQMEQLSAIAKERCLETDCSPNTITFNSVLNALSKSRKEGSATRAEQILRHMQDLHTSGDVNVQPDAFSFSSVLNAHANSNERGAGEKAERILKFMFEISEGKNDRTTNVKPNTVCFSTVIKAYSKSRGDPASAQKAEDILKWMLDVCSKGDKNVEPNAISFTSVADAWAKSGDRNAVQKINNLILWMNELHESGYKDILPNTFTYNCLINAIARSKDRDKPRKALAVLRNMQKKGESQNDNVATQPNLFTYNSALLACAFAKGSKRERFDFMKIAIEVFEEALQPPNNENGPLNVTYGSFFQALGNLNKTEIEKKRIEAIVEKTFKKCCLDGQVDNQLLRQIQFAASSSLYLRLLPEENFSSSHKLSIRDLPKSWSRNVR